jgi:hypothetical protein
VRRPASSHVVDLVSLHRGEFVEPLGHQGGVVRDERILAALEVFEAREARTSGLQLILRRCAGALSSALLSFGRHLLIRGGPHWPPSRHDGRAGCGRRRRARPAHPPAGHSPAGAHSGRSAHPSSFSGSGTRNLTASRRVISANSRSQPSHGWETSRITSRSHISRSLSLLRSTRRFSN